MDLMGLTLEPHDWRALDRGDANMDGRVSIIERMSGGTNNAPIIAGRVEAGEPQH